MQDIFTHRSIKHTQRSNHIQLTYSATQSLKKNHRVQSQMSHKHADLWQAAASSPPTPPTPPPLQHPPLFHTISDMLVSHYGSLPKLILLRRLFRPFGEAGVCASKLMSSI